MTEQQATNPEDRAAPKRESPEREKPTDSQDVVQPLDYARPGDDPGKVRLLPLLGGLIVGLVCVGVMGVICVIDVGMGAGMGADRMVIATLIIFALLLGFFVFQTIKHLRSRPRNVSYWFLLGVLLGGGTMALLDGLFLVNALWG